MFRQLDSDQTRTAFAIIGVALAVLSVTLHFGVGEGVFGIVGALGSTLRLSHSGL